MLSVTEFCLAYEMSRRRFHQLCKEGRGPTITREGWRTFITEEDARTWALREHRGFTLRELGSLYSDLIASTLPGLLAQHGVDDGIRVLCRSLEVIGLAMHGTGAPSALPR
jgi:hypothetical protein